MDTNIYIDFLNNQPCFLYLLCCVVGACVGSFLNVVIYRLPIIIERTWKEECNELFDTKIEIKETEKISLSLPRSSCPNCKTQIPFYHNIPIFSYLILKGSCFQCQNRISTRYFVIELFTMLITCFCVYYFGVTSQALFAAVFSWLLIALMVIDYHHYILPDNLNFALLWLGIIANVYELYIPLQESVLGVIIGYSALAGFAKLFELITGKEGMGQGDFKLFAALGAWVGWEKLLLIIIGSSVVGAMIGITLMTIHGRDKSQPLPFGPFLGIAGWIVFFFGEWLVHQYFNLFVVHY